MVSNHNTYFGGFSNSLNFIVQKSPPGMKHNSMKNLFQLQLNRSRSLINDAVMLPITKEDMIRLNNIEESSNKLGEG